VPYGTLKRSTAMSALGQKQTSDWRALMSAIHPKADIDEMQLDVRFVPKPDELHRSKIDYSISSSALS
jgi:hypothetical protein